MSATIARRIGLGLVVVALVAWWAIARMHQPHYSDTPGQGAVLQRLELPALDTAKGGPIPLPPSSKDLDAVHNSAEQAVVLPPIAVPAPVGDRQPDATPQDPQLAHQPGSGAPVHDPMPGTPGFEQNPLTLLPPLPVCDAACLKRVLDGLTGGLPIPPVEPPIDVTP